MIDSSPVVGIDLGTTNSSVSICVDGRARMIRNSMGEWLIPSVIALDQDGSLLTGSGARARVAYEPGSGLACFKRDMGTDRKYQVAGLPDTPIALSALMLRELVSIAEEDLGVPVQRAVITVPAYFQEPQRAATRLAAEMAGLEVMRLVNEPTAAAIAYGLRDARTERRVMVIDLGGGTFDVTVLEIFEGIIEVSASTGDSRLGGEDFTDVLLTEVASELGTAATKLSAETRSLLRSACEVAKCALVDHESVLVRAPVTPDAPWPEHKIVAVTRERFAELNHLYLQRIRRIIRDALIQAQIATNEVDEVVLVGGATRMPVIRELAEELFGSVPHRKIDPDSSVAIGAALQAAMTEGGGTLDDVMVTDVVPFSLGVRVSRSTADVLLDHYFLPVIHRNTAIPVSAREVVSTITPDQTYVVVEVYQGEHRHAAENLFLGRFTIDGIPPVSEQERRLGLRGQAVELTFTHDMSGLLEVEAKVLVTGETASIIIDQAPGRLSESERAAALAQLDELKRHPKEFLPNRHLLETARHLHALLSGPDKAHLDDLLFSFEAALETRAPQKIEQCAQRLREACADLASQA